MSAGMYQGYLHGLSCTMMKSGCEGWLRGPCKVTQAVGWDGHTMKGVISWGDHLGSSLRGRSTLGVS